MALKYFAILAAVFINFYETEAHGRLMEPVGRASAWRKGFPTPTNYEDNGIDCGGRTIQYAKNDGKCGVCGDNYALSQPRPNENGGMYGKGVIVQKYKSGSLIEAKVILTANHLGYFEFALCPLKYKTELETEECFDSHRLEVAEGEYRYPVKTSRRREYLVNLKLPQGLTCENCVLRWQYVAGNNPKGTPQETFRNCADVAIH